VPLADDYECFLLDLDGVLYRGDEVIPAAPGAVEALRQRGRGIAFVTNNSSKTPGEVADRLTAMGIAASAAEVVTSALATADLLRGRGAGSVYVVGERGVTDALAGAGMRVLEGEPDGADYVVVGWDRSADYGKLRRASLLVQRGARLVATNGDRSYPAPDGLWPGAGALLAVITTTTGARAEVIGKPNPQLFQAALTRVGGGRPLVVGDRLDTDIAGAASLGWDSLLVWSGVSRPADLRAAAARPTFVAEDVGSLCAEAPKRL
jgi:glycerol-1-phosphatase